MKTLQQGSRLAVTLGVVAGVLTFGSVGPRSHSAFAASSNKVSVRHQTAKFHDPNLQGQSLTLILGATPQDSDTTVYVTTQILKSWGANVQLVNVDGDPLALRAVLAGSAGVAAGNTSTFINGGLVAFGPNQPHVDYFMVGRGSLKKVTQLRGHPLLYPIPRGWKR